MVILSPTILKNLKFLKSWDAMTIGEKGVFATKIAAPNLKQAEETYRYYDYEQRTKI